MQVWLFIHKKRNHVETNNHDVVILDIKMCVFKLEQELKVKLFIFSKTLLLPYSKTQKYVVQDYM